METLSGWDLFSVVTSTIVIIVNMFILLSLRS